MNIESPVKGIIFSFFSLITGISLFLPAAVSTMTMSKMSETSNLSMISSFFGIVTLIVAAGCIFLVFAGLKQFCGWGAAALAVIGMINGFRFYSTLKANAIGTGNNLNELLNALGTGSSEFSVEITWGFYVYIIALVLTVFMGIVYAMAKD